MKKVRRNSEIYKREALAYEEEQRDNESKLIIFAIRSERSMYQVGTLRGIPVSVSTDEAFEVWLNRYKLNSWWNIEYEN